MKETFRALNGLRFFAALEVLCFHFARQAPGLVHLPLFAQNVVNSGPIALGFFYMLSGFVLTHAYRDRAPTTRAERRRFWMARVARLYPVYLLAFVLFVPMAYEMLRQHSAGVQLLMAGGGLSLVACQSWTPLSQVWNQPSWSLSVEAFFYLLFPFLLAPLLRIRGWRLVLITLVPWLAMVGLTIAHEAGVIQDSLWLGWIQYNPVFWLSLFVLGVLSYRLYPWLRGTDRKAASCVGIFGMLALVSLCGWLTPSHREILMSGGAGPLMALIILAFAHPTSAAVRWMGTRVLFEMGAVSYITYILQAPGWRFFLGLTDRARHASGGLRGGQHGAANWQFFAFLAVLIAGSFLVRAWVERPAQHWILQRFGVNQEGR